MQVDIDFLLKKLVTVIQAVKLTKVIILEENVAHHPKISIESKLILLVLECIDFFIDPKQVVLRIGIKSILMEEHEKDNYRVITV